MKYFILILYLILITPAFGQDAPAEKLATFTPFIGTWKAEFADGTHDVNNYEWILSGITETQAGYTMKHGEIHVWSQFFKNGEWAEKNQATYVKSPDSEVKF